MDNKERERIINKIKHCLALSKSDNENEAATAIRQATNMMKKYSIGEDEMSMIDVIYSYSRIKLPTTATAMYVNKLASMIARTFSCKIFYKYNHSQNKYNACFVGMGMHSEVASYAFDVLFRQLKSARINYLKNDLNRVRIKKNKYSRADNFCAGWVQGVNKLVRDMKPPTTNMKAIGKKINNDHGEMSITKIIDKGQAAPKVNRVNDFSSGYKASEDARLHTGVNADSEKIKISY